ncbi:EAL domain-containing protein [Nostoc sp. PCC 7524]|uniref:caspase, EACC1-associated type n=1 Tax=Nostoc sp. (strain ATCC 29411 / PCC 7524) TaxID=28072 RepID=UPI00029F3450|nr:EAL domain-containing protein [Nostoc sp. PCC 7524]AFY50366.1 EAL domain-containing protein [Nostoc sp. PCC 7524]
MAKVALLIGVSEYLSGLSSLPCAVRDIDALQRVLQDPDLGGFSTLKSLKNPVRQDMEFEIEAFFAERTKDDLLLFYFSGHGIKDDSGNLFFATSTTQKTSKGELIRATAVSASFIHDVMRRSRAKRQIIILDCCFSGAFDPSLSPKDDRLIDFKEQLGAEGRVVLASSSSTEYSFEQQESELSIYTRYLVEGVETGAADLDGDGLLSIEDIHGYVNNRIHEEFPHVTPKIIVLKNEGYKIILSNTKAKLKQKSNISKNKIQLGEIKLESSQDLYSSKFYNPVPSLIQPLESFISRLSERLKDEQVIRHYSNQFDREEVTVQNFILEVIRQTSDADFVFVMHRPDDQGGWILKSQSNLSEDVDDVIYTDVLKNKILSNILLRAIFTPNHHGIYRIHYDEKAAASKAFLLIPLESQNSEFIVICGLSTDSYLLNDAYGRIISSFYKASQELSLQSVRVEAAIIDDLKITYGYLPFSLYQKRFTLFCERLARILIYFEPILDLDDISISGWEALARDPDSLTAPVDLFAAAEIWGRKFTIELDQHLLKTAVNSYQEALVRTKQNRYHEILPLSVNVYPESLMRTAYFETVREIVKGRKEKQFSAKKLILEISEKADLPMYEDGIRLQSPLDSFKMRLAKYTQELKIRFGIDDFGVGYASVSRLSGLQPPYVKIDREILYHQPVDIIINFVQEVVSRANPLDPAKVIVEGLDENSPVTLGRLKNLGVSYVQGHIIGKAEQDVNRLSQEKSEFLRKSILGE